MKCIQRVLWTATAALLAAPVLDASAGVPYPTKSTPAAVDRGPSAAVERPATITLTVALKLSDPEGAKALLEAIATPGSPSYHAFLTPAQFAERFGPSAESVARTSAALSAMGLSVNRTSTTTLHVTGTPEAIEKAFQVSLHTFEVPAAGSRPGYTFRAPASAARIPDALASDVHTVLGLDTRPRFAPRLHQGAFTSGAPTGAKRVSPPLTSAPPPGEPGGYGGFAPGEWTVAEFAQYYNVKPLYYQGITGKGRTLGIVTLASFTPSDAYAYWKAVGLSVDPNRITVENIDGGPGAPSDASGSGETSLDVEQSGGIAYGSKIIVYQAPNTSQGFVDAFAAAIDSNLAQTVSVSWGEWEWFDNLDNSPVIDPISGKTVSSLQAYNELFLQAALQGQSFFASAGDAGAYDANDGLLPPDFSLALSVDSPASDPYITAAGGTTLSGIQVYSLGPKNPPYVVNIPTERVWSWDYLNGLCADLGYTPITCGVFPVGGGGGVSVYFQKPSYQQGIAGVQLSQPGQVFTEFLPPPAVTYFTLTPHFPGRNLPDISFNADPDTGYSIYYTSDQTGFSILTFYGGTSFVGPQLNGVTALIGEYLGERVGLLNYPLYQLARNGGYSGSKAPLRAITAGDNDFYKGSSGYNPGAGLGTLNVYNFAEALKALSGK